MEIAPDEGLKTQQCSSFKIRFRGDDEMRGLAEALFSVGKRLYLKYHPLPIVDELARHLEEVQRRPENDPDYLDFEKQAEQHFVETAN